MGVNEISSTCIPGPIGKFIELPDGYVVNGSVYDKINTAPIPKSFFAALTSTGCESCLKEVSTVGNGYRGLKAEKSYILDRNDTNIVYLVMPLNVGMNNGTCPIFYKLKRSKGKYTVVGSVVGSAIHNVGNIGDFDIIDDDSTYVYLMYKGYTADYASVVRIHKDTMAVTSCNISANGVSGRVTSFYQSIVNGKLYGSIATSTTAVSLVIVDLATFTATTVASTQTFANALYQYMRPRKDGNVISFYGVLTANCLWRISYDLTTSTLTSTNVCTIPESITLAMNTAGTYWSILPNKDYIIIKARNETTSTFGVAEQKILLFSRNTSTNEVTYKDCYDPGYKYYNFLFADGDDLLYIANKFRVDVISVTDDRMLTNVQTVSAQYLNTIGRDSYGNIFLISDDTKVSVFNREIPINITASFEKEYQYVGVPIQSYITIDMKNHLGNPITGNVRVELMGPAVFDDSTQSKVVTVTGSVQVPIIVVDTGDLRVNITNE